ncbi:MAG: TIGR03667 family PPOX class F420-dependent oxidoreductase [Chloroflexi bacterium]|nr:TIGR03667 family PPOX class F420-dependent oxidoreductase [Chloroflexota bacterium]
MEIDTSTDFGARVARRLREDQIGWLTTVRADGLPQPTPVWFLWDGATFLIFSQPKVQKIRNIEGNSKVSLHLDGDGHGGDIVVISGEARVVTDVPRAHEISEYVEKYREGIKRIGMTPEQMAQTYSTALRLTPSKLSGH